MPLQPGTWRLRVSWLTHVSLALAFGLFSSGLAAVNALALLIDARVLRGANTRNDELRRV